MPVPLFTLLGSCAIRECKREPRLFEPVECFKKKYRKNMLKNFLLQFYNNFYFKLVMQITYLLRDAREKKQKTFKLNEFMIMDELVLLQSC